MAFWTEVKAHLAETPEDWAIWAEKFERFGIFGTVQTDHPPTMSAYLAPGQEDQLEPLKSLLIESGAESVTTGQVEETDWAEAWKQFFKPWRIGQNWVIRPTWEEYESKPGDRVIVLDPGQAFGTGDHPTTRGCLRLMESISFDGREVADIGCGSGILSAAAMLLGAKSVEAVDVDSPAVEASRENAQRNGVEVSVYQGRGFDPLAADQTFDIVLSNIISAALIGLAPESIERIRPGGHWLVSGIHGDNWFDVEETALRCGFTVVAKDEEDGWVTALLLR
jgi:ribosomal protein L11 methyltransferase